MGIGNRIKTVRGALTQLEFARKIQVDKATVSTWETTDASPKGDILERIHHRFSVNINWLLTGEGDPYIDKDRVEVDAVQKDSIRVPGGAGAAVHDQPGLYGRTRQMEVDGVKFDVTVHDPIAPKDPFAEAVSSLRDIFNSRDPVLIPAIQANLRAFQISARRERQIGDQKQEIQNLRDECEDLKKRIRTLETRFENSPSSGPGAAESKKTAAK